MTISASNNANHRPMQMLGPAPNGIKAGVCVHGAVFPAKRPGRKAVGRSQKLRWRCITHELIHTCVLVLIFSPQMSSGPLATRTICGRGDRDVKPPRAHCATAASFEGRRGRRSVWV